MQYFVRGCSKSVDKQNGIPYVLIMNPWYYDFQVCPEDWDDTTLCDGCMMRILRTEVVSPPDWSESFCVLCMSPVPEVSGLGGEGVA